MIKLKDILNEIEYDDGKPMRRVAGSAYTWDHSQSIPFKASSLEVIEWDEYPDGGASWVSYVYQGESPFALNPVEVDDDSEVGLEDTKKDGLVAKILSIFKKKTPSILKSKPKPLYPVISVVTDNHHSDKHNRFIPTSIRILVGTDTTKDWALPPRDTSWGGSGFAYGDAPYSGYFHPDKHNVITVYESRMKGKYANSNGFHDDLTDAQKKFIEDILKTVWEKPNRGITTGVWVIRKVLTEPDEWDPEYDDKVFPKSNPKTGDEIGDTDPRFKDGFWNMEKNQWGPYKEATKFNDRSMKSIRKAPYVIKSKDSWEFVLISK